MSLSSSRPRVDVRVIDLEGNTIPQADVSGRRQPQGGEDVKFVFNELVKSWTPIEKEKFEPGLWAISVTAPGRESQSQTKPVTERGVQTLFILGRPGLPFYYRGGVKVPFDPEILGELVGVSLAPGMENRLADLIAVARELGLKPVEQPSTTPSAVREGTSQRINPKLEAARKKYTVESAQRVAPPQNPRLLHLFQASSEADGHEFERRVASLPFVARAGKVVYRSGSQVSFLTNEIVVQLQPGVDIEILLRNHLELKPRRQVNFAANIFILQAPGLRSSELLLLANRLVEENAAVISAEPNLVSSVVPQFRPNDLDPTQLHHPIIDTEGAWDFVVGSSNPSPLIAVIDEGCEVAHVDFASLVNPFNFATLAPQLFPSPHGTMAAGVAAATYDNRIGIAGVAGMCQFMPIQYPIGGADEDFADMFVWAAGLNPANPNRPLPNPPEPGADVISNSWGLGENRPLSRIVESALDFITTQGRNGKGSVVVFASGDQGDDLFVKQPWAAHPNVIAVGSSSVDQPELRVPISNFGASLDLVAPGGDEFGATWSPTAGTDSSGVCRFYEVFGETSCACPQVAGVAAMMLFVKPELTAAQIRNILQITADKIDTANGMYDTDGHSDLYGFGRLNAHAAVQAAHNHP